MSERRRSDFVGGPDWVRHRGRGGTVREARGPNGRGALVFQYRLTYKKMIVCGPIKK